MPKYPGISPYDNEKGTLGTAKKRWEKLYVKEIESDTVSGINASIENLATTATNSVSAAVSAKNDAVSAKQAAEAAQTAAETAAAGIQSVVETDVDNTLSIAGVAADAKVTGDWLRDIAKPVTLDTSMPATAYAGEFMKVTTDSEGRVLYGVKRDGTFTWQKGVPRHVIEACNPTMDNPEWLYLIKDLDDTVLFGIKRDGSVYWQKGTPKHVIEACNPSVENPEYLYAILDPNDTLLFGIKKDGSVTWGKGIPSWLEDRLNESTIENDEYLYLIRDTQDRVVFGIKNDGSIYWQKGSSTPSKEYILSTIFSDLPGKRWAAFGDSHTARTGNPKKYWQYIAEQTGVIALDYGVGGSGYYKRAQSVDNKRFLDRIRELNPDDFDFMTIFGSANDCYTSYPFGEITDHTEDTVLGCVNLSLDEYYNIAPTKPLGLITPCPWYSHQYAGDTRFELYVNALIEIARRRGIPCLDFFHDGGMQPWNDAFAEMYYYPDKVHPNDAGHKFFIAPKIKDFILKLI